MSYQVLALKWRPQKFEEVVGQENITRTLQNAIRSQRVPHAFLFAGSRGVGKTTSARILAKALVCEHGPTPEPCNRCRFCQEVTAGSSLDVLEIDGASNRGIDEIRDLRENVRYAPAAARLKIYVIDEVHMLTKEAFNALLKTLEEPPPHVKFIFATTEVSKVPVTIQSRCQRFDFRLLSREEILAQLEAIARKEEIEISPPALATIAGAAEGSLRDGESLLDQVIAYSGRKVEDGDVYQALGLPEEKTVLEFLEKLIKRQGEDCLRILDRVASAGLDPRSFTREILNGLRHLVILKASSDLTDLVPVSLDGLGALRELAGSASPGRIQSLFEIFIRTEAEIKNSSFPRMLMELAVIRAIRLEEVDELRELVRRLEEVEQKLPEAPVSIPSPAAAKVRKENGAADLITDQAERENGGVEPGSLFESRAGEGAANVDAEENEKNGEEDESKPGEPANGREGVFRKFVQRVRKEGVVIASFLEHGRLTKIGPSELEIAFDSGDDLFLETLRERDNFVLLRRAAREIFNRRMEVSLVSLEEERQEDKMDRESDLKKKRRREALEHPAVQEALAVFKAQVVDVKIL